MADDGKTTDLIIRAKNFTDAGFAAATANVQRLRGEVNTTSFGSLERSLRQFDDVLELVGGPHMRDLIQGVGQLQDVASGASGKLDLLAKAGLTVSAAMGGWQIGRKIAEFTGSDKLIGDATARLFGWGDAAAEAAAAGADVLARASKNAGRQITDMTEAMRINEAAAKRMIDTNQRANASAQSAALLAGWRAEIDKLRSGGALEALRKDLESQNFSQKDLADRYRLSTEAVSLFARQLETEQKALDKSTKAVEDHKKAIADLAAKMGGDGLVKDARQVIEALESMPPIASLTRDSQIQIAKSMEAAMEVYRAAGKSIPLDMKLIAMEARAQSKTVSDAVREDIEAMQRTIKFSAIVPESLAFGGSDWATRQTLEVSKSLTAMLTGAASQIDVEAVRAAAAKKIGEALSGPGFWKRAFGSAEQFGADFANAIMGAIQGGGSVVNAGAGMIGQKLGKQIAADLSKSLTKEGAGMLSKALGGMLDSILPGVGALLGPLMSKVWDGIKGLFGMGTAGRDLVKDFAASFGGQNAPFSGFDALQKKMLELGPEYERLWKNLTQNVGRNNAQQAKAAIDEVTRALEANERKVKENAAAAEQAAKQVDAAQQAAVDSAKARVQQLDDEIKTLQDSIAGEAPEEEMGIVERITREKIAAMQDQRAAAAEALNDLTSQMTDAVKDVAEAIEKLPDEIALRVRVAYEEGGFTGGGSRGPSSTGSGGATSAGAFGVAPVYLDGQKVSDILVRRLPDSTLRFGVGRR